MERDEVTRRAVEWFIYQQLVEENVSRYRQDLPPLIGEEEKEFIGNLEKTVDPEEAREFYRLHLLDNQKQGLSGQITR